MSESHLPFDAVSKIEELERRIWELERRRLPTVPTTPGIAGRGVILFPCTEPATGSVANTTADFALTEDAIVVPADTMRAGAVFHYGCVGEIGNDSGLAVTFKFGLKRTNATDGTVEFAPESPLPDIGTAVYFYALHIWASVTPGNATFQEWFHANVELYAVTEAAGPNTGVDYALIGGNSFQSPALDEEWTLQPFARMGTAHATASVSASSPQFAYALT